MSCWGNCSFLGLARLGAAALCGNPSPLSAGPKATRSLSQSLSPVTQSQTSSRESWNQSVIPSLSHPSFPCQPTTNSYSRSEAASQFLLLFTVVYLQGFALLHFLM